MIVKHALVIGSIDKVSARVVIRIQQFEGRFLVHAPHAKLLPFVPDAHTTQLKGGNMNGSMGGQGAVSAKP